MSNKILRKLKNFKSTLEKSNYIELNSFKRLTSFQSSNSHIQPNEKSLLNNSNKKRLFSFKNDKLAISQEEQVKDQLTRNEDVKEMTELIRDFLDPAEFYKSVKTIGGIEFFCGVPDSLLKGFNKNLFCIPEDSANIPRDRFGTRGLLQKHREKITFEDNFFLFWNMERFFW